MTKKDDFYSINVYAIFDKLSQSYQLPMFAVNDDVAIRNYLLCCIDDLTKSNFVEEFDLRFIGVYYPEIALIEPRDIITVVTGDMVRSKLKLINERMKSNEINHE